MDMLDHIKVTLEVPRFVKVFYGKVGKNAGRTAEEVMSDMLLNMAGELSLRALHEDGIEPEDVERIAAEREAAGLGLGPSPDDPDWNM